MARRHIAGREQWEAHTKDLAQLVQGDNVFLQNLVGNHPRRWERTGKVVECKGYDQYLVKVDGTGRTTLRNRKHLRKFQPIPKHPRLPISTTTTAPEYPPPGLPAPVPMPRTDLPPYAPAHMPQPATLSAPGPQHHAPSHIPQPVMTRPDLTHTAPGPEQNFPDDPHQCTPAPSPGQGRLQVQDLPTTPAATSPDRNLRPQRDRRPNVRLDPAEWELGKMDSAQQFVPTMDWCLDMIRWIAKEGGGGRRGGGDK